jgi:hypothetical protein
MIRKGRIEMEIKKIKRWLILIPVKENTQASKIAKIYPPS